MTEKTILLVGNATIDQVFSLPHYPQENEEIRAVDKTEVMGGNACNSAQILAQLGAPVELMTALADDNSGRWLMQQLQQCGIGIARCAQYQGYCTPQSSIWLNQKNGSRSIVHYRDLPELSLVDLQKIATGELAWIHFEGRNVPNLQACLPSLQAFRERVSLEIEKPRSGIEALLPLVGTVIVSSDYLRATRLTAQACIDHMKLANPMLNIVCTLGEDGVVASDYQGRVLEKPAEPVKQVVDTIGAGDCFIAGLISKLAQGQSFEVAVDFASQLAAKKIQNRGMHIA